MAASPEWRDAHATAWRNQSDFPIGQITARISSEAVTDEGNQAVIALENARLSERIQERAASRSQMLVLDSMS
jgi:hypothetical protein